MRSGAIEALNKRLGNFTRSLETPDCFADLKQLS